MNRAQRKIIIHPFGEPRPEGITLNSLEKEIANVFRMDVSAGSGSPVPGSAYDARRRQYRSSVFLPVLRELRLAWQASAGTAPIMLGIAEEDLYAPSLNFVFGEADPMTGVAVISLHRLRPEFYGAEPDPGLFKERVIKEAVHELGHVFGLMHCDNPQCIMHFSNSIADTDFKGPGFCRECRARLAAHGITTGD